MLRLRADLGLQSSKAFSEPRLPSTPQLRLEFSLDSSRMGVDIGHRLNGLLGLDGQIARRAGSAGGHRLGDLQKLVVVDTPMGETDARRLLAIHDLAEHDGSHRHLRPGDATEHPRVPAARMQADLQKSCVELGSPRGQADIASQREVHPSTNRGAVDRRQRRQWAASDSKKAFVDGATSCFARFGQIAEVGTGAEGRRRTCYNDRSDGFVAFDLVHRRDDLVDHFLGQGVAFGRIVEGQRGHTVGLRDDYEGHGYTVVLAR